MLSRIKHKVGVWLGADPLLWSRDLDKHFMGEYSYAVIQGNNVIEDHSQVEIGRNATFVGVYDGHGGPQASSYVSTHLFNNLIRRARDHNNRVVTEDVIRNAFAETEEAFIGRVAEAFDRNQLAATVGSCCLVGCIWQSTLLVANLGDSRAVIGVRNEANNIVAEALTDDHNVSVVQVRNQLQDAHPGDSTIVQFVHNAWRVKGIIQVTRAIGDAYMKYPHFAVGPQHEKFHMAVPLVRPALIAVPDVLTRNLQPRDQFLIFASDGLWALLSNQQAVDIVQQNPRNGIAKRLVKEALMKVERISYEELKKVRKENRRQYHDDISVVVVYLDHHLLAAPRSRRSLSQRSIRGSTYSAGRSDFRIL